MVGRRRRIAAIALVAVLGTLTAGCSGEDSGETGAGAQSQENGDGDADALLQEGLDAHVAGDLDTAEARYLEVVELDPDNALGWYNLGLVEQTTDRPVEAQEHYRLALNIDPNFTSALFNLAILRTEAQAFDEAVVLYAEVTTLDEANSGAHLNLGLLLYSLGQGTQAARQLARAVELDPGLVGRATALQPAEPQTPDSTAPADGD